MTGQAGTSSYTDTNDVGPGPFLYRVGVTPREDQPGGFPFLDR